MTDRFMARQPILESWTFFAYELLLGSGAENFVRPGRSCAEDVTVNLTMLLDMQQRVGNTLAFINADAPALPREAPRLLSLGKGVFQILGTVQPT